jgi:hypothetical protein
MKCPECLRLRAEYDLLKKMRTEAVERLFAIGYSVSDTEYRCLKAAEGKARSRSEIARFRLERHLSLH